MKPSKALLVIALVLSALGCTNHTGKKAAGQKEVSNLYLPDLKKVLDSYDSLSKKELHLQAARLLLVSNRDLKASQLYLNAAVQYCKANMPDSAAVAMQLAIDNGMADPNILTRDEDLIRVKNAAQWPQLEQQLTTIGKELRNKERFVIRIEPLYNFWPYFDRAMQDTARAREIFKEYILKEGDAVRDFYVVRYLNTDRMYSRMIRKSPQYYAYLKTFLNRDTLLRSREKAGLMMTRFAELYPGAVFPDVNVMPGILNSGGTATEVGLYIGGDMFGKSDNMPTQGFDDWHKNNVGNFRDLHRIIVHELMHFQQHYRDRANVNKVIGQVIAEGVCDFLVELCSGEAWDDQKISYLEQSANRDFILADFKKEMFSEDISKWMYNANVEDRPVDIGYTLGYKIAKSYYERSKDKRKAIDNLLNTDSFVALVSESEYGYLLQNNPDHKTK